MAIGPRAIPSRQSYRVDSCLRRQHLRQSHFLFKFILHFVDVLWADGRGRIVRIICVAPPFFTACVYRASLFSPSSSLRKCFP